MNNNPVRTIRRSFCSSSLSVCLHAGAGIAALIAGMTAVPFQSLAAKPMEVSFTSEGVPIIHLDGEKITRPTLPEAQVTLWNDPIVYQFPHHGQPIWPAPGEGALPGDADHKIHFDPATKVLNFEYEWGSIQRRYQVEDDRLDIQITIENKSDRVVHRLALPLLSMELSGASQPSLISEAYFGQWARPRSAMNFSEPVVLPMEIGERVLVPATSSETPGLMLRWEIPQKKLQALNAQRRLEARAEHGDPNAQAIADQHAGAIGAPDLESAVAEWDLSLHLGGGRLIYHQRYSDWQLLPGSKETIEISIRLGDRDDPLAVVGDVLKTYAERHPQLLNWEDRRPIVRSFLGDGFKYHAPQGPEFTVPDAGVSETFRKKVMDHADQLIGDMREIDAQGMILWNVEGNGNARLQYVGTPTVGKYLAPEMDAVADEFFKRILDAGFRTGVCLRPSSIVIHQAEDGSYFHRHAYPRNVDVVDHLDEQVKYAQKRWGCTLFYVDTNIVFAMPTGEEELAEWPKVKEGKLEGKFELYQALMNSAQWEELLRRNPDVLFLVEHSYPRYYTSQASYDQMNMGEMAGSRPTPPLVRRTWPGAFKALTTDKPQVNYHARTVEAFQNNDIVMTNVADGSAPFIKLARDEADLLNQGAPDNFVDASDRELEQILSDPEEPDRNRYFALRFLQERKAEVSGEILKELVQGPMILKLRAIEMIRQPDHAKAVSVLLPYLRHVNEPLNGVASQAVKRLGEAAVEPLAEEVRSWKFETHLDKQIVNGTAKTLGLIDSPKAARALLDIAGSESIEVWRRDAAIRALSHQAARPEVVESLVAFSQDPRLDMAAAFALTQGGSDQAEPVVQRLMEAEASKEKPQPHRLEVLKRYMEKPAKDGD